MKLPSACVAILLAAASNSRALAKDKSYADPKPNNPNGMLMRGRASSVRSDNEGLETPDLDEVVNLLDRFTVPSDTKSSETSELEQIKALADQVEDLKIEFAAHKIELAAHKGNLAALEQSQGCEGTGTTVAVDNHNNHFVPGGLNNDGQPSEGDLIVWQNADMKVKGEADIIGSCTGTCVQVTNQTVDFKEKGFFGKFINCIVTLFFDGTGDYAAGSLTLQGEYEANMNYTGSKLAVTGGTDGYKAAKGESTLRFYETWDYTLDMTC